MNDEVLEPATRAVLAMAASLLLDQSAESEELHELLQRTSNSLVDEVSDSFREEMSRSLGKTEQSYRLSRPSVPVRRRGQPDTPDADRSYFEPMPTVISGTPHSAGGRIRTPFGVRRKQHLKRIGHSEPRMMYDQQVPKIVISQDNDEAESFRIARPPRSPVPTHFPESSYVTPKGPPKPVRIRSMGRSTTPPVPVRRHGPPGTPVVDRSYIEAAPISAPGIPRSASGGSRTPLGLFRRQQLQSIRENEQLAMSNQQQPNFEIYQDSDEEESLRIAHLFKSPVSDQDSVRPNLDLSHEPTMLGQPLHSTPIKSPVMSPAEDSEVISLPRIMTPPFTPPSPMTPREDSGVISPPRFMPLPFTPPSPDPPPKPRQYVPPSPPVSHFRQFQPMSPSYPDEDLSRRKYASIDISALEESRTIHIPDSPPRPTMLQSPMNSPSELPSFAVLTFESSDNEDSRPNKLTPEEWEEVLGNMHKELWEYDLSMHEALLGDQLEPLPPPPVCSGSPFLTLHEALKGNRSPTPRNPPKKASPPKKAQPPKNTSPPSNPYPPRFTTELRTVRPPPRSGPPSRFMHQPWNPPGGRKLPIPVVRSLPVPPITFSRYKRRDYIRMPTDAELDITLEDDVFWD
ncbi:uncharacterized protein LOC131683876 [Topomyia yanbarensis]|uniref:uncharacterized protein LOC131683876 n=1 Tax=Topomyia yanbarensis TaxID=2498891 RepID=UPI00273B9C9E|nr:uncharacterized protein LOC131683876 [Topomyia yanbarensis]